MCVQYVQSRIHKWGKKSESPCFLRQPPVLPIFLQLIQNLYGWINFNFVYVLHFLCLFLYWQISSYTLRCVLRSAVAGYIVVLTLVDKPSYWFPQWLSYFSFPLEVYKDSLVPYSHSPQCLLLVFLMVFILTGNLGVVLICISLMVSEKDHFFQMFIHQFLFHLSHH